MKSAYHIVSACLFGFSSFSGGAAIAGDQITVFAAASLKNALDSVVLAYGNTVVVSYGGSAIMARQVAMGAPADVVILANETWMNWLEARNVIAAESRIDLLSNSLVVVAPKGAAGIEAPLTGQNFLTRLSLAFGIGEGEIGRLAIGQTKGVPAGIYARSWLEAAGLWGDVAPHLAEVENVRVALALVARAETPLGVVYASDALAEPRVDVVYKVPRNMHLPIVYPAAWVTANGKPFLDFLQSSNALSIFENHGFLPPEAQN